MDGTSITAPDYRATTDGRTRLEVRPRPKWLTTSALIAVAVALLAGGVYALASARGHAGGPWAAVGLAVLAGGLAGLRLHRAANEIFVLDLRDGAHAVSYDYFRRETVRLGVDALAPEGALGEVEVSVSTAPGGGAHRRWCRRLGAHLSENARPAAPASLHVRHQHRRPARRGAPAVRRGGAPAAR